MQFGVTAVVVDEHLTGEGGNGGRPQPVGTRPDFEARVGSVERLALFTGQQFGQRFGRCVDRVGGAQQEGDPLLVRSGGPGALCVARFGDGSIEFLDGVESHPSDDLAGGGIIDLITGGVGDALEQGFVRGGHGVSFVVP